MAHRNIVIHVFRNDLRIHDNEALSWAFRQGEKVIPLYCFDPREFSKSYNFNFPKTAIHRARFLLESVKDLRDRLCASGSNLFIRHGKVGQMLNTIISEVGVNNIKAVTIQKEVCSEELKVEKEIEKTCSSIPVKYFWGSTLYHKEDIYNVQRLPDVFTQFRKDMESRGRVRNLVPDTSIPGIVEGVEVGNLPNVEDLNLVSSEPDPRSAFPFKGGETAALARLKSYLWDSDNVAKYKETRNGMVGSEYSTKFSPWLAHGCLSPRKVYWEIKSYESSRVANQSTYWVIFELTWRDYFRYVGLKFGNALFLLPGIRNMHIPWKNDMNLFRAWAEGRTGVPYVDANMRELKATGFMSNRGRQNVASFLTKDLKLDWRLGAEWFESQLLDYDPCSNYGNWLYVAGLGNDPRNDRKFNVIKQGLDYDPNGEYVRLWVPELKGINSGEVHSPWNLSPGRLRSAGLELGVNYPNPLVMAPEWSRHVGRGRGRGGGRSTPQSAGAGQKRGIDFYFSRNSKS